jgi:very-short-patch-repair endonuclease
MSHPPGCLRWVKVDRKIEELASEQYGAVSVRQVRNLGADRFVQARRVSSGRWFMATRRVIHLTAAPPSPELELMTWLLDAGRDAVASHESAAWLWRLPGFVATDVVIRRRALHSAPTRADGHRPTLVLPHHRTLVRGIACTTLPRTLVDLGAVVHPDRLARLVDNVVTKSPAMLPALHTTFGELAQRGRKGIAAMRRILQARPVGAAVPASGLEARFERILANAGERPLRRQVDVGGQSWLGRVDYLDDLLPMIIEIDSELHHTSPLDTHRDAERDAAMLAAGFRKIVRVYEEEIWYRPWAALEKVRAARRELTVTAA